MKIFLFVFSFQVERFCFFISERNSLRQLANSRFLAQRMYADVRKKKKTRSTSYFVKSKWKGLKAISEHSKA